MSTPTTEWFISERVRALAMVALTRRDDLLVEEPRADHGFDLLVSITNRHAPSTRQFAVVLKGTRTAVSDNQANQQLTPSVRKFSNVEFTFPVCIFYFTMEDDKARYAWIAEPKTSRQRPTLEIHREARCQVLDDDGMDCIITAVTGWYDLFAKSIRE